MSKQNLLDYLQPHGQEHLVQFWEELDNHQRQSLVDEIKRLHLAELKRVLTKAKIDTSKQQHQKPDQKSSGEYMQPVPDDLKGAYATTSDMKLKEYEEEGLRAIGANQVAVILLAGGQGTRLGVDYPKGVYSVGLASKKSLLQLQAERLLKLKSLAASMRPESTAESVSLPWYIMTSEHTLESTVKFFEQNGYFGLEKRDVMFFKQGTLPCFFNDGRIIMDSKWTISRAPDGNGGLYRALAGEQGVLDDMAMRGIKYVHVYCVDNILVKVADPVFTGFCIGKQLNCGAKVVKKVQPEESVGVICKRDGVYQVVEYSEISEAMRNLRIGDEQSDLVFNAGNICNHFFTFEFLETICRNYENELEHHVASKKIPYMNEQGVLVKPAVENGIKLEKFIFDVFKFSNADWAKGNFGIWEVLRDEEFAPLKNSDAAKSDNPRTCRENLMKLHATWLQNAGAQLNTASKCPQVEISPLVSYNGEGLEKYVQGRQFSEPLMIELDTETQSVLFNGRELDRCRDEQEELLMTWRLSNGNFAGSFLMNTS